MASTKFTYSPASGNGNTNVSVTPSTTNTGTTDNNATLTFTDGNTSKSVSIKQLYCPYAVYPSSTIPASGGSLSFTPHTEYPVVFQNKPSWITIKRGNTVVNADTDIAASTASGATFSFIAEVNTGGDRQGSNFQMAHKIGGVVQSSVVAIPISQSGGTVTEFDMDTTVHFNGTTPRTAFSIQVTITSYSGYSNSYTFTINAIYTEEEETIHVKLNPTTPVNTNLTVEVIVNQSQGTPVAGLKSNVTFQYGDDEPEVDQAVVIGDTSTFYTTYNGSSVMDIGVEITF